MKNPENPKPDFTFKPNTIYEITICPDNDHQGYTLKQTKPRYQHWRQKMVKIIRKTLNGTLYWLHPEVSHSQSSHKGKYPRLHLHGIILFPDFPAQYDFLINNYRELTNCGLIQFNPYREEHWLTYINKDTIGFKQWLHSEGLQHYEISNCIDIKCITKRSI